MMIRYNPITTKEARDVKKGDKSSFNGDRLVVGILFGDLSTRFATRNGGYTRIIKKDQRMGDNAPTCFIEFLPQ